MLIRHGESVANLEGRFTFDADEPLTELGRAQARQTAERLRPQAAPTTLYPSPFRRAFETAVEIGHVFGLVPVVDEDLREQDFGVYKGRPYEDFYGSHAAGGVERWHRLPEGGERLRDVATRAGAAIDRLASRHPGEEILIVCHGGVLSALRAWVAGDFSQPPVPTANAWGYRLEGFAGRYRGPIELVADPE